MVISHVMCKHVTMADGRIRIAEIRGETVTVSSGYCKACRGHAPDVEVKRRSKQ